MKERIYFAVFGIVLGIIAIVSSIMPVWWHNNKMQKQIQHLQKEIHLLKQQKESYTIQKKTIEKDPGYIEYLLRNKMHYGKKGEKILD